MGECPCCKKTLEKITDFPEVKIIDVNITQPGEIPSRIMIGKYLDRDNPDREVDYEPVVREIFREYKSIKDLFKKLESVVGQTLSHKDIFPDWFEISLMGSVSGNLPEKPKFQISTRNTVTTGKIRELEFHLLVAGMSSLYSHAHLLKIADMKYEGILYH